VRDNPVAEIIARALVPKWVLEERDDTLPEGSERLIEWAKANVKAHAIIAALEGAGYRVIGRASKEDVTTTHWSTDAAPSWVEKNA
jgi:hypothetical protein